MGRIGIAMLALLLVGGCQSSGDEARPRPPDPSAPATMTASPSPAPSITFGDGTVIIEGDDGPVLVPVEVAESSEQRSVGLMFRESLDPDTGMLFMFFEDTSGGFWMKNTKIPLSIAFFDDDGKILEILDMEPCRADPCPVYEPGVAYRGALEVNVGAFARWGVSEGDVLRITR